MQQVRRILTREDIEKKKRRNNIIMSIILAVIMLFSVLAVGYETLFSNNGQTIKKIDYNGIEFTQSDYGTWKFQVGNSNFETKFNPKETENISVSISKTLGDYYQKPIYFGINTKSDISTSGNSEIWRNMYSLLERNDLSCLDENCTEDKPIKNCSVDNVIIFKESNESLIKGNEGCIFLYSPVYEQERIADAFLFKILGI